MLTGPRILPSVMIVLSLLAAFVYFLDGDMRRGIYWISAGVLTASVTY
jgi:hypothetical protein